MSAVYLYRSICSDCGLDKGLVGHNCIELLCRSCSRKRLVKNPDFCVKFRNTNHDNVDYTDFRLDKYNKRLYRHLCPKCNKDVGYRRSIDAKRKCKDCRVLDRTKYSPEQKRIRCSMKANISFRLRKRKGGKNCKSTFDMLPYTLEELMIHLQSKFKPGMTWDNYGKWEIDHIRADSTFSYSSYLDIEFQKSWSLNNLQPLWKLDNIKKGTK